LCGEPSLPGFWAPHAVVVLVLCAEIGPLALFAE